MMLSDDHVPVDFSKYYKMCARQESKSLSSDGAYTEILLGTLSSVLEHDKGIEFC